MFWHEGVYDTAYTAGTRASLELFWKDTEVGYCSTGIGACALYDWAKSILGINSAWSLEPNQGDLEATTLSFLNTPARQPVVTHVPPVRPEPPVRDRGVFETPGGERYKLPDAQYRIPQRNADSFKRRRVDVVLTPLDAPEAIRKKAIPDDIEKLRAKLTELRRSLYAASKEQVEFIVPFYVPSDPELCILVKRKRGPDSVLMLVHDADWANWTLGAHFDAGVSQVQIDRLAPIIRSARMTSVFAE
jgi:hypothetical protein